MEPTEGNSQIEALTYDVERHKGTYRAAPAKVHSTAIVAMVCLIEWLNLKSGHWLRGELEEGTLRQKDITGKVCGVGQGG